MSDITDQNSTDQRSSSDNAPDVVCEKSKGELNGMKSLQFPDITISKYYSMKFAKYVTETGIQRAKGGATPAGKVSHYSEIILPLPTQVIDNSQIGYSTPSLGLLGRGTGEIAGALNDAVTAVAGKDAKDMVGELSNQGSNFVSSLKEKVMNMEADEKAAILKTMARQAVDMVSEGASAAIDLAIGNVVNPHLALLFENVPLKAYSFNWTLSPSNKKESEILMNIIGRLKFHAHPEFSENRLTFNFPDEVHQSIIGVPDFGENGSYLFKPAAITNVTVDYTPQGGSYFQGGSPTMVNLSVSLQEAEIFTSVDYKQFDPRSGSEV